MLKTLWRLTLYPLWAGWWFFGLSLLVWYPLRWWPGDQLLPVRMANYFMPWLLVGLIPGLLAASLARRYRLLALLAAPTLLIGLTYAPLFLPRSPVVLAAATPFKVMSYNVFAWNRNIPAAAAVIRQEQPDILLLQEVTPWIARQLQQELAGLYPHRQPYFIYQADMGQAIISRYPLTPLEASHAQGRVQKALVDTPAGPMTVWNVHPNAPDAWSSQQRQISNLAAAIAQVKGPLIVGGDFNTTNSSEAYRLFSQYLDNAHWQAGWGFGFSFPADKQLFEGVRIITPVVRIDHVFYSHHFFVHSASTLTNSGGSDHRPVVAELSLTR